MRKDVTTLENDRLLDRTRYMAPVETPADEARKENQAAEREFECFERVAVAMADGSGWFDPAFGPDLPSGYVVPHPSERPAGVPRGWTARSWIRHLKYMGNACAELNPEKSSEYLSRAEQLEDHCNA